MASRGRCKKDLEEGAIGVEAKKESNELLVEGVVTNDNETWVSFGKPTEDGTTELEKGATGVEAKEVINEFLVERFDPNDN